MQKYADINETLGYETAPDSTNTDGRFLVAGSENVLIDQQRKVKTRAGYTVKGPISSALTPMKAQAPTWNTSTGVAYPLRAYDVELEVFLGTVDGAVINAYKRVKTGLSATEKLAFTTWWDTTEGLDLLLYVLGDATISEWSGGVAVVASVTGTTITKAGTTTFAQNRFYVTRNMTLINVRTGTEYTYSGGMSSTTLTGITDTTGIIAGDILIQKVLVTSNKPTSTRTNDSFFTFQNQVCIGSNDDERVYMSKNTSYVDFTYSSPRLPGDGVLLENLESPVQAFGALGTVLAIFAGRDNIFRLEFNQQTVGTTNAELFTIRKLQTGIGHSAQSQEFVVPIGNSLAYISFEPTLRIIDNPNNISGIDPKTYSNPIQPDFDAETFTGGAGIWYKNSLYFTAPVTSHMYILEYTEDADGKVRRFWQPPQMLPIGALSIIDGALHGHSNSVPESYRLFHGGSDREYDGMAVEDKIAISYVAGFAYRNFGTRENLKNFDEYYCEGQIQQNTNILLELLYDFGGATQLLSETIYGSDTDITYQPIDLSSLGQPAKGTEPLGGSSVEPDNAYKFRVIFEEAKEDFHEIQEVFSAEGVDLYFSILARGMNARLSTRRDNLIRK